MIDVKSAPPISRVSILGGPGSGKSTLAREVGQILGLEVVHMDALNFTKPAGYFLDHRDEFLQLTSKTLDGLEGWVSEGNYSNTYEKRLPESDLVIYIDRPTHKLMYGILKRRLQHQKKHRAEMPSDWKERLSWSFVRFVLRHNRTKRVQILDAINLYAEGDKTFIVTNRRQQKRMLAELRGLSK